MRSRMRRRGKEDNEETEEEDEEKEEKEEKELLNIFKSFLTIIFSCTMIIVLMLNCTVATNNNICLYIQDILHLYPTHMYPTYIQSESGTA